MCRKRTLFFKYMVPRKKGIIIRLCFITLTLSSVICGWWLSEATSMALLPPYPSLHLDHFRLNRSLKKYLDNIELLIEPSTPPCKNVPLVIIVTSSPTRFEQREAIRRTWAKYFPTYFIMGLNGPDIEDMLVENYVEAKKYSDIIIYKFQDHYQNLTLKTGLMIQWCLNRCSPGMLFKTDDDVLVNPWILKKVVEENANKDLVGYRKLNSYSHRDEYNKWYLPRWLLREDFIPEYLSGTGYIINGKHLENILTTAYEVPMINLEDVYFTYLVSKLKLNLTLTHDHRLSPYKPWMFLGCLYWGLGSIHSLTSDEMINKWVKIENIGNTYDNNYSVCDYFINHFWSEWFLY